MTSIYFFSGSISIVLPQIIDLYLFFFLVLVNPFARDNPPVSLAPHVAQTTSIVISVQGTRQN